MLRHGSRGLVVLLAALVACGQFSTGLYLPSLPAITAAFGTDGGTVALTLTVFLLGFGLAQLVYGPLADRFGRRPVLIGGLCVFAVTSVGAALAASIGGLIVARLLQAFGACAGQVVARAVVRDIARGPAAARLLTVIGMVVALAPPTSQFIGGQLQVWLGWRASFLFLAAYGLTLAVITWRMLPETLPPGAPPAPVRRILADYRRIVVGRRFLAHALTLGFAFGCLFSYLSGAPHVIITMIGLDPGLFGVLATVNILGYLVGSLHVRRHADRLGPEGLVRRGSLVVLGGGLGMGVPVLFGHVSLATVMIPMFVFLIGLGLILPGAMAGAMEDHPTLAGTASALLGFIQIELGMAASLAVSLLFTGDAGAMAGVFTASAALTAGAARLLPSARPCARDADEAA